MNYTPLHIDRLIKVYIMEDHQNFLQGILITFVLVIGILIGKAL